VVVTVGALFASAVREGVGVLLLLKKFSIVTLGFADTCDKK
jgi:hypothetical protein